MARSGEAPTATGATSNTPRGRGATVLARPLLLALVLLASGCVQLSENSASLPTPPAPPTPSTVPTLPVAVLFNGYGTPVTVTVTTHDVEGRAIDAQGYQVPGAVETPPPSMDPGCANATRMEVRVVGPDGLDQRRDQEPGCQEAWLMVFVDHRGRLHLSDLPRDGPDAVPGWERGDDWPEDVPPERYFRAALPSLSLQKSTTERDGRETTVFTVVQVRNGPLYWEDLDMECRDGAGPEAWGGDHDEEAEDVRAANNVYCDGTWLTIVHVPTNTMLYDQAV